MAFAAWQVAVSAAVQAVPVLASVLLQQAPLPAEVKQLMLLLTLPFPALIR